MPRCKKMSFPIRKTRLTLSTTPRFKRSVHRLSKILGKPPSQLVEDAVALAYGNWERLDPSEAFDQEAFDSDWALPEMEVYDRL
jgi:hypothetical protein